MAIPLQLCQNIIEIPRVFIIHDWRIKEREENFI